ncbi:MAG: SAM-dependent methyltransferase [Pelagibacteraceae bacterium]|nr:SAM-dependent methyltransferase [Pelagibacteraceae bacterium]|tara:strand:+ start:25209 stop:26042 length:834 start_codon:yes stop_codon:yes gene_type:complete
MNRKDKITNKVIKDFGLEWKRFNQSNVSDKENKYLFNKYFENFPWKKLNSNSVGMDVGCGSGRWTKFVARRVKKIYCIEPSNSIEIAKINLKEFNNCEFINSKIEEIDLENNSLDFGYSLGVLHHVIDTIKALKICNNKLKKNAPFLVYLYYNFENKPLWYKIIWNLSNFFRIIISRLPYVIKIFVCDLIAILVYLPFSRIAKIFYNLGFDTKNFVLSSYMNASFTILRNDSLDRFGTHLEKRYNKKEIADLLYQSGFDRIKFNDSPPYWTFICYKK